MTERDQIICFAEQAEVDVLADIIASAPADVAARHGFVLLEDREWLHRWIDCSTHWPTRMEALRHLGGRRASGH